MKRLMTAFLILFFLALAPGLDASDQAAPQKTFGIAIHGGAGVMSKDKIPTEKQKAYQAKLKEALNTGYAILEKDGSSLEAIEAAIRILEDSPLFNAGKGAVFTAQGTNELDASVMDGLTLNAGAVSGVKHVKNPISLAKMVMTHSPHVMLTGDGAEAFAKELNFPLVSTKYFFTQSRWESLQRAKNKNYDKIKKSGTVGAEALDKTGNLAAGTSTGGMTNKKFGRIGDSPVIGAGTYANNHTCAVSGTGYGEYFIRSVVAYDISALMEYNKLTLNDAAGLAMEKVKKLGGYGGVIAMDVKGNVAMPFTTAGMFRGFKGSCGTFFTKIFKE